MPKSPPPAANAARARPHLVLDTNVIVSGLLNEHGIPGRIVDMAARGQLKIVYSSEIMLEYAEVLMRPKFNFDRRKTMDVMGGLYRHGIRIRLPEMPAPGVRDVDDIPFFLAAVHSQSPLVTGNKKHFPEGKGAEILTPAEFAAKFPGMAF